MNQIQVGILIVSDRAFRGERSDATLPLLLQEITAQGWNLNQSAIVPDEIENISAKLVDWADQHALDIILTSGGTGFAPRDITPEATKLVIEKEAPGLAEAMRAASVKTTPYGMLSRGVAGIRKSTIIINLPGSPKGAIENFQIISAILPHAVVLVKDNPSAENHHKINH